MAGRAGSGALAKGSGAFRTIGEVVGETGIAAHILRYWETRFPQLRPVTRAGQRRYYRPDDVALIRRIDRLLHHEGYTMRGVQQVLAAPAKSGGNAAIDDRLRAVRDTLKQALERDGA